MVGERFVVIDGTSEADFTVNGVAVLLRLQSASGQHNQIKVFGSDILAVSVQAFRSAARKVLERTLAQNGLSGFDTTETLRALDAPLEELVLNRLAIVGEGSEEKPYQFGAAEQSATSRLVTSSVSDLEYAIACVQAACQFNGRILTSALHAAAVGVSLG